jgi:hypothetical protein
MATGSLNAEGVWIYGEDDSEPTFSELLNKLGDSVSDAIAPLLLGGRVIQTVTGQTTTTVTSSSTTPIDSGLTATITPLYSDSLILVMVAQNISKTNANASSGVTLRLLRGASLLIQFANFLLATDTAIVNSGIATYFRLDNPNTTSPVTYKTQINNSVAAAAARAQFNGASSIVLMEIKA